MADAQTITVTDWTGDRFKSHTVVLDVHPLIRANRNDRARELMVQGRKQGLAIDHDTYCAWTWPHPGRPCQFRGDKPTCGCSIRGVASYVLDAGHRGACDPGEY